VEHTVNVDVALMVDKGVLRAAGGQGGGWVFGFERRQDDDDVRDTVGKGMINAG
jgi:hypothetical protein